MVEPPTDPSLVEYLRDTETFADTMFSKMALTLLIGEFAKLQGGDEEARAFLNRFKETLSTSGKDLATSDSLWDVTFRQRFSENIKLVFEAISVGPVAK